MGVFEAIDETFEKFEKTMNRLFGEPALSAGFKDIKPTANKSYRVTRDDATRIAIEVDVPGATGLGVSASSRDVLVTWTRGDAKRKLRLTFADAVRMDACDATLVDGVLRLEFLKASPPRVVVKVRGRDGREI